MNQLANRCRKRHQPATERARVNRALSNAEIKSIVSAVGGGIARDFRVEDMRYAGIAIFVDADVDGLHIMTLLLTLFWRFMRPMIDAGRLYVARAPLYQVSKGRRSEYAYTEWERDQILSRFGKQGTTVQRYKGLGEMNPSQLKETVFSLPEADGGPTPFANRNLFRVTVEDAHQANQMVQLWMGTHVGPRKSRLMAIWDGEATFDELGGTIGRADTNNLVLPDPERAISRTHAQVVFRAGAYALVGAGANPSAQTPPSLASHTSAWR